MDAADLAKLETRLANVAGLQGYLAVRDPRRFTFSIEGPRAEALAALEKVRQDLNSPTDWNAIYDSELSMALAYFSYGG